MTPLLDPPRPATATAAPGARAQSTFGPLASAVRNSGYLDRQIGYYVRLACVILGGIALTAAGVVLLSHSWWAVLLAVPAALLSAQVGFFGHDAGHQQISASKKTNRILGFIAGNVLGGLSYGWWQDKHLRHHANPNHEGLDPDVAEGTIVWSDRQAAKRTGFGVWLAHHQADLFFPLLTFEGWSLMVSGLKTLRMRPKRQRILEASLLGMRHLACLAFLFVFLTPGQAVVFVLIHQALYGLNLGMAFAPNHKGMLMPEPGTKMDHLHKQVLTSRDVSGGWLVDQFLGGLNYQIEHHLFPSMPRPHLRKAQPMIRDYCLIQGLPFRNVGFVASYVECLDHLRSVGNTAGHEAIVTADVSVPMQDVPVDSAR
jgi:fatty acid desaturase